MISSSAAGDTHAHFTHFAAENARSIFRFLERTAEARPDGVRWSTLDWHNRPHYTSAIHTGCGGIVFFLADYHRITGDARALRLAEGLLDWCASPERDAERDPEWDWCRNGIMRGRAGLGLGWLALFGASRDKRHLARAAAVGERLLAEPVGPVTDWQDGSAGEALFHLRLAEATGEARFLEHAVAHAAWLESVAVHDAERADPGEPVGCVWPWQADHPEYAKWFGLSFVPGSAGIAHVLLSLRQRTGDARWAALARGAGETLRRQARPDRGGLNWPDTLDGFEHGDERRCQLCYGASGVGLFFVKAFEVLGDPAYRELALAAGEATHGYGDVRRNPCLCHGLAGSAELFLDLHRITQDSLWHTRAAEFARLIAAYRTVTPEGDVWQSDDPGCHSPDFLYGASGTGHFFLRLWRPDFISRPLT